MTGAVSAAIMFPTMRELDPRLPGFAGFGGDHWKLAAGRAQSNIFIWADFIQLGAAALAFLTLGLRLIGAGVVLVACNLMILAPRMNPHLKAYWQLAREGQTVEANGEATEFSAYHPAATTVHGGTAVAVLVALVAGAWSLSRRYGE